MNLLNDTILGELIGMHIKIYGSLYSGTPRFNFMDLFFIVFTYRMHMYLDRYERKD
jgi:hypothetical protein